MSKTQYPESIFKEKLKEEYKNEFSKYRQEIMNMLFAKKSIEDDATNTKGHASNVLVHAEIDKLEKKREMGSYNGLTCMINSTHETSATLSNPNYEYDLTCETNDSNIFDINIVVVRQRRPWKAQDIVVDFVKIPDGMNIEYNNEIAKNFWMILSGEKGDRLVSKQNLKWIQYRDGWANAAIGLGVLVLVIGGYAGLMYGAIKAASEADRKIAAKRQIAAQNGRW